MIIIQYYKIGFLIGLLNILAIQLSGKELAFIPDTLIYSMIKNKNELLFASSKDSIKFSNYFKRDTITRIKIENKYFFIETSNLSYIVKASSLNLPFCISYLGVPYYQLDIDEQIYNQPELVKKKLWSDGVLKCYVKINNKEIKNEKLLTDEDWATAKVLGGEPVNELLVYNSVDTTIQYASLKRVSKVDGNPYFIVNIAKSNSIVESILFKVSLFMILWEREIH